MKHRKRLLCLVMGLAGMLGVLLIPTGCEKPNVPDPSTEEDKEPLPDWKSVANATCDALITHFWGASFPGQSTRFYFNYASNQSDMSTNHYWPQAHAMDVLVDAYLRTKSTYYLDFYDKWFQGVPAYNYAKNNPLDPWWTYFVDDMEWVILTQLRLFESSGDERYISKAKQMYNQFIITTWAPANEKPWYGGITWNTNNTGANKTKNACSNAPAAIIAAKIYLLYDQCTVPDNKSKQDYLDEAVKIYDWQKSMLYVAESGAVYDHIDAGGNISTSIYSYNQGTFLGAAHLLYQITQSSAYLNDAVKAAYYTLYNLGTGTPRRLSNVGTGDGGLFHGIFFRYFAQLAKESSLSDKDKKEFAQYLEDNAVLAYKCLVPGINLFSTNWVSAKVSETSSAPLNAHVTGATLMAAMANQ